MTQEEIKSYFEEDFEKDIIELNQNLICKMTVTSFFKHGDDIKNYKNKELLIIFLYELNLISQIVHNHFRNVHEEFLNLLPNFPDTLCFSHGITPMEIIPEIIKVAKSQKIDLEITNERIMKVDIFFKDYLIKLFESNRKLNLSWEKIEAAIKEDPDINKFIKKGGFIFSK